MQKRRLGRTGLQVSVIGFGGIPIIALSRDEAEKVVRHAYERGINYFDTARAYGDSEEKMGAALNAVRDEVIIATKTHQRTKEDAARAGLKQSLRNLQTDRIDLVQLHGIDSEEVLQKAMGPEGALRALEEAKTQERIDYIGISGHNPYVLGKAIKTGKFDAILVPLNVIDRRATEELFSLANEADVGVVIMKAMGGCGAPLQYPQWGARFLGKPEQDWPDSSEFVAHFGKDGIERAKRSLRFVLAHDIDTVIPGPRSIEEVDHIIKVAEDFHGLSNEEKTAYKFEQLPPEPFCRKCGLCMPCPDGVEIPTILRWDIYYRFYNIKKWTRDQYPKIRTRVNSCTECGNCEEKCPYSLPVIRMLKEAKKRLE
ncbi:MAG: aldo/keto reductase [Candidatus Bathyarchaeota archaeon]|nr:aldo/keto reductase [Candidatus Bathyarchaeota archaeon]MDH5732179.1 aldo/keto reductase [Candidatus Bathyarchaeota archaeon]